ncbi:MAG TPA: hypothetical protein VK833_08490 [Gillisia sp.]|nr:hypothetical protein [Gillisia sp.]
MKNEIKNNIDNPGQLEKLYRDNKAIFKKEFNLVFPDIQETTTAQVWKERLNFETEEISWGSNKELLFIVIASFIAGLIAKIPDLTGLNPEYFYPRNISFVVFPLLAVYFAWKQKIPTKNLILGAIAIIISAIYINSLPNNNESDTLILACIHLPLLLWAILGASFVGDKLKSYTKRLEFLRFNGDLVVMTGLLLITGGLLTGITLGLFSLIELNIEEFYFKYIVIWGLAAAPIVATYLVRTNPQLVNKVSPVIAKVFTPLLFVMLVIYLCAVIFTGKDPYNDREFLMIFNVLLIGVMAIILFSIAETSKNSKNKIGALALLGLSIVTIIVNGIALSAIVFRISELGITPNRLAVLGGNILILTNLLLVTFNQFKAMKDGNKVDKVENSIASFLPVYIVWAILVTFIFPILFNFK